MFQVSILESPARPRPVGNLNAMPPGPCHHHPSTHNSTIKMNLESVKQSRIKSVFTSGSRPGPPRRRGPVELELKPPRAVGRTNFNLKTEPQPQTPPALERSGRAHCQLEGTASDSEVVARRPRPGAWRRRRTERLCDAGGRRVAVSLRLHHQSQDQLPGGPRTAIGQM